MKASHRRVINLIAARPGLYLDWEPLADHCVLCDDDDGDLMSRVSNRVLDEMAAAGLLPATVNLDGKTVVDPDAFNAAHNPRFKPHAPGGP